MFEAIGSTQTPRRDDRRGVAFFGYRIPYVALLLLALAATALIYAPGLTGPLLLDDEPNLAGVRQWLDGTNTWQWAVLGNASGPLGRPLSMASFVLNAATTGDSVLAMKCTNLALHLCVGVLAFFLLRRLLVRDPHLAPWAAPAALLATTFWLLHPLQVSTVLYVVQRMAQLSALFVLLALLAYLRGRDAFEAARSRAGGAWLFGAFPLLTGAAMLCKENGVLAPLLCAVLEVGYFAGPRPRAVRAFFLAFLVLPGLAVAAALAWKPGIVLDGYAVRDFSFAQRLLSEPRALWSYMHALVLPNGGAMGVFADDFAVSTGFFAPLSTAAAILGGLSLARIAIAARRAVPALFSGLAFFLAAHALESSIFPLELYFEHRNYLPSIGFFLALVGALAWAAERAALHSARARLIVGVGACALALGFAAATHGRAWVWQRNDVLVAQTLAAHPTSLRARMEYATLMVHTGRPELAAPIIDRLTESADPSERLIGAVYQVVLSCFVGEGADPSRLDAIRRYITPRPTMKDLYALDVFGQIVRGQACGAIDNAAIAPLLRDFADASTQPEKILVKWKLRVLTADAFARARRPDEALEQARIAWEAGARDPALGELLVLLHADRGELDRARAIYAELAPRISRFDRVSQAALEALRKRIE